MGDVIKGVSFLYDAGYIRQALEKSSANMSRDEIQWIMEAVGQRLRRQKKPGKKEVAP